MSYFEVDAALNGYFNQYKNNWEQTRLIAYITASCYASKQLKPTDIIKFSWDIDEEVKISPEELQQRKDEMLKHVQQVYSNKNISTPPN